MGYTKEVHIAKFGEESWLLRMSKHQSEFNYIKKYGEEEGKRKWVEYNKSKGLTEQKCILKYGEEEGKKRWVDIRDRSKSTLENFIRKHGEEEGKRRWAVKKEKDKIKGTLQFYLEKYGEEEGLIKYLEKNSKISVSVESLTKSGYTEDEINEIKKRHSKNSACTLERMIKDYGEVEGTKRYNKWVNSARERSGRCKEHWIKKGFSEAQAKQIISFRQGHSKLENFIEKYGKELGTKKYVECNIKKAEGCILSSSCISKLETKFFEFLSEDTKIYSKGLQSRIIVDTKIYVVDYLDPISKKIIEVFGYYWHTNPKFYSKDFYHPMVKLTAEEIWKKDEIRINNLKNAGFKLLIIWEDELYKDLEKQLLLAKEFLEGKDENKIYYKIRTRTDS